MNDVVRLADALIKTEVFDATLGVGSFFNIFSKNESEEIFNLWIYNVNWALTKNDQEINCSYAVSINNFDNIKSLLVGNRYSDIIILDDFELHILFDNIALECWFDNDVGNGGVLQVDFLYLYKNNKFVYKASSPLGLSDQVQ